MRFIDGNFIKGEPMLCRDFIELTPGEVVWAKAVTGVLNGPFQVLHRYEPDGESAYPTFIITDVDNMGIDVICPTGLGMNTNFGFMADCVGQINIFQAVRQNSIK